jgi:hypothetical protein
VAFLGLPLVRRLFLAPIESLTRASKICLILQRRFHGVRRRHRWFLRYVSIAPVLIPSLTIFSPFTDDDWKTSPYAIKHAILEGKQQPGGHH